jgi:hypothetical protein
MIYTMNHEIKPFTQALLTKSELAWLVGKIQISKVYEYRIKSDIKKKLQTFQQIELPLLMEKGFIFPSNNNHLSVYTRNLSANPQLHESTKEARIEPLKTKRGSLGRDSIPGPLPYQGNALPG